MAPAEVDCVVIYRQPRVGIIAVLGRNKKVISIQTRQSTPEHRVRMTQPCYKVSSIQQALGTNACDDFDASKPNHNFAVLGLTSIEGI